MIYKKICITIITTFLFIHSALAFSISDNKLGEDNNAVLKVGIILNKPPFEYKNELNEVDGLSIKIWESVADELKLNYEYVHMEVTQDELISNLADGKIDLAIAPMSVTHKRSKQVDFTRPYFMNYVGVAISTYKNSMVTFLAEIIIKMSVVMAIVICTAAVMIGFIMWLIERGRDPDMPKPFIRGYGYAMWSTCGTFLRYLVYEPHTRAGRFVSMGWLFLGICFMIAINAVVTSSLTVALTEQSSAIQVKSDLALKKIAVSKGSAYFDLARKLETNVISVDGTTAGLRLIESKKIMGYIGDYFVINNTIDSKGIKNVKMAPFVISNDEYAFALPKGSPLKRKINATLVKIQENQKASRLCSLYMGKKYEQNCVF